MSAAIACLNAILPFVVGQSECPQFDDTGFIQERSFLELIEDDTGFIQERSPLQLAEDDMGFIQERAFLEVLEGPASRPALRRYASLLASKSQVRLHSTVSQTSVMLQRHKVTTSGASGARSRITERSLYAGQMSVGMPPQNFTAVFDTGSGNLLAPSTKCGDPACTSHMRFDITKSSSGHAVSCDGHDGPAHDQLTIAFGTGRVTGTCWRDVICIGDACAAGDLVLTTHESDEPFQHLDFDGVQGLALATMSQGPSFHLMSQLKESLQHPYFGVFLSENDDEQSHISFGQINPDLFHDNLIWMPVSRNSGYWELKATDITIDNVAKDLCKDCRLVFDTGSSELSGPSDVIEKMESLLQVDQNCSNSEQLPRLGFILGHHVLNLMPDNYVDEYENQCYLAFMKLDVPPPNGPVFVLGVPFLQQFYTAYDIESKQLGFALAKHVGEVIDDPAQFLAEYKPAPTR